MLELVPSNFKNRLPRDRSWPSLAGTGLPERMRTTAFAFLGLTAAAGLALVAIFAQVSFHVLSPAPLPSEPAGGNAVAEAVALDHSPGTVVPVVRAQVRDGSSGEVGDDPGGDQDRSAGGSSPAGGTAPAGPAPDGGGAAAQPAENPAPDPAPVPASSNPSSAPAPQPQPVSEPAPAPSSSSPKPAPTPARPAAPTPAAPPAPGNSSSSAAAAHASDRGVEASSKSAATVEPPPAATSSSPTPNPSTSSAGNGKALGHTK
jgi:outer membrane biosynthesis protein TonB